MSGVGHWLRHYMLSRGLDPERPQDVARAKFSAVFDKSVGGAPTIREGFERALATIRERDPEFLENWRVSLSNTNKSGSPFSREFKVEQRSAVDRLADIAEAEIL